MSDKRFCALSSATNIPDRTTVWVVLITYVASQIWLYFDGIKHFKSLCPLRVVGRADAGRLHLLSIDSFPRNRTRPPGAMNRFP